MKYDPDLYFHGTHLTTEVLAEGHDFNLQGAAFTGVCQICIFVQCEIISVIWSGPFKVALCGDFILVTVSQMHIWNELYR